MRKEDRKPSKRVFPLLQNLDLDSVTFAQIQSTGNPITIQDMNEQEMLDLIIVNLARLCTVSEWTGLLEAGGGGSTVVNYAAAYPQIAIGSFGYPVNSVVVYSSSGLYQSTSVVYATPFYASTTGDFHQASLNVSVAGTTSSVECSIYSSTDTGGIDAELCTATIDLNSSGERQGTFSGSTDAVAGTLYWFAHIFTSAANPTVAAVAVDNQSGLFVANGVIITAASDTGGSLPASWTATTSARRNLPLFGVTYN